MVLKVLKISMGEFTSGTWVGQLVSLCGLNAPAPGQSFKTQRIENH